MTGMLGTVNSLTADLQKASGQKDAEPAYRISQQTVDFFNKNEILRDIPIPVIRKAWFTMAHLLLAPGSKVANMGSTNGQFAYAMAAFNPHLNFIAVEEDRRKVARARNKYVLPNLEFVQGDISGQGLEPGSLDAIVNSFTLNEVYSGSKYHEKAVLDALERQFSLLRPEGLMFLRDYPMPPPGEMVLLEMPDVKGTGKDVLTMSEPELLVWFAERARPKEDPGCNGFFMEELPPRFPGTRLFRLPYKWFYEFITRKDDREHFEDNLPKEFAFFTKREFRKALRMLGARVLYSSPHWDEALTREKFTGRFRVYRDDGSPLGMPPTSFIAVAQKMGEGRSLRLLERRPSSRQEGQLKITAMRNENDGRIVDVVSRGFNAADIIPYRIDDNGDLMVFLHDGAPRGITNAVQRSGKNMDEKFWSGHMTEAIAVNSEILAEVQADDVKSVLHFARDVLGMKPAAGALLEKGPGFFPAPDFIDEHVVTRYLRVDRNPGVREPKSVTGDLEGFTTVGRIREVRAQDLLNALSVGYIPNARLEVQILALFDKVEIKPDTWETSPLTLKDEEPDSLFDAQNFAKLRMHKDRRFKPVRGTAGTLRPVQSIFVDEGWVDGGLSGLGARDMEFVIPDENTTNKAVVLPLTRNAEGTVLAGITAEYLPVPQRFSGNGLTVRAPSFDLPKEITTMDQAQKFIADKFMVRPENVFRLGESFFLHPGVTPQRVFPFAVAAHRIPPKLLAGVVNYYPIKKFYNVMFRLMDWNVDQVLIYALLKAYRFLGNTNDMTLRPDLGKQSVFGDLFRPHAETFEDMTGLAATKSSMAGMAADSMQTAFAGMPPSGSAARGKSGKGGDAKGDGDARGEGDAARQGSEPAFIASNEEYAARPASAAASASRTKSGGGTGSMGGKPRARDGGRPQDAKTETPADAQQQQAQAQQQQAQPIVVQNYRSEPVFDAEGEEFVPRDSKTRDPDMQDKPEDRKNWAKSGSSG